MLADKVAEMVLVVRDLASPKLPALVEKIRRAGKHLLVRVTDKIEQISDCAIIVTASNTPEPLIHARHLTAGPVVICDISLPSDVAEDVELQRPDVLVIHGGVVRLPCNDDLTIGAVPLAKGNIFACMAETILMGLEGIQKNGSIGSVRPAEVLKALGMAERHGFVLADDNADSPGNNSVSLAYASLT
jgi:predicted amino acid dehydrogenase